MTLLAHTRAALVIAAIAATLGAAGCGGSAHNDAAGGSINQQTMRRAHASDGSEAQMKEQFIVEAAGKRTQPDDMDYRAGTNQCSIYVWLTSPALVNLYASAGDEVVTNTAQSFGVKIGAYQGSSDAACASEAQQVLATVR